MSQAALGEPYRSLLIDTQATQAWRTSYCSPHITVVDTCSFFSNMKLIFLADPIAKRLSEIGGCDGITFENQLATYHYMVIDGNKPNVQVLARSCDESNMP